MTRTCKCGRDSLPGRTQCQPCTAAAATRAATLYAYRTANRLCTDCGDPLAADEHNRTCAGCRAWRKARRLAKHGPDIDRIRAKNRYYRLKAAARCTRCGATPPPGHVRCQHCADADNRTAHQRRQRATYDLAILGL